MIRAAGSPIRHALLIAASLMTMTAAALPALRLSANQRFLVTDRVVTSVPGAGRYRFVATRDADGSCAMVYAPAGRTYTVHMERISGSKVKAWWFNPRDGSAAAIGEFPNRGERALTPPQPGEWFDWVLVLDDAARGFPPPGRNQP